MGGGAEEMVGGPVPAPGTKEKVLAARHPRSPALAPKDHRVVARSGRGLVRAGSGRHGE
jgi:hypothetical protein